MKPSPVNRFFELPPWSLPFPFNISPLSPVADQEFFQLGGLKNLEECFSLIQASKLHEHLRYSLIFGKQVGEGFATVALWIHHPASPSPSPTDSRNDASPVVWEMRISFNWYEMNIILSAVTLLLKCNKDRRSFLEDKAIFLSPNTLHLRYTSCCT